MAKVKKKTPKTVGATAKDVSVNDAPENNAPAKDVEANEAPANDTPAGDTEGNNAEAPANDAPADETPAGDVDGNGDETPEDSEQSSKVGSLFESMKDGLARPSVRSKNIAKDKAAVITNLVFTLALEAQNTDDNSMVKEIESNMIKTYGDDFTHEAVGTYLSGWGNNDEAREAFLGLVKCKTCIENDTLEEKAYSEIQSHFLGEYKALGEKIVAVYFN